MPIVIPPTGYLQPGHLVKYVGRRVLRVCVEGLRLRPSRVGAVVAQRIPTGSASTRLRCAQRSDNVAAPEGSRPWRVQ
eukprot:scaffold57714_cov66-Phaeocystis_antarctica.AAC.6